MTELVANHSLNGRLKRSKKTEGILSKKPVLKPIIIGIAFSVTFFGMLYSLEVEVGYAFAFSVTSAIALIAFIRHEFSKEQNE